MMLRILIIPLPSLEESLFTEDPSPDSRVQQLVKMKHSYIS